MSSFLSDRLQSQALAAFAIREILEKPLVGETPQSRIKQIGLVNILYMMHQAHEPLTLAKVMNFTGMTRGGVIETMDALVQRGILQEILGKNSMGRGTARQFEFAPEVFSQIRSTI
ncbi:MULTISPECIES: HAD family hydrolase [Brucella/Ochrobactrum group]|uniref:transcriptional regulator n=1 Tax=Brucella/Ochrobactrum group TaxID=2826938 RepID=UPI0024BC4095|nr:transcriptional regulator [Brucella sp. NM4]WHS32573.1 transcriptional regulator [Brucella sp. NM4]WHT42938.1 transcriptional regulator [Ochrobactrum sp. SSR]